MNYTIICLLLFVILHTSNTSFIHRINGLNNFLKIKLKNHEQLRNIYRTTLSNDNSIEEIVILIFT